jgi:hypothetical protein
MGYCTHHEKQNNHTENKGDLRMKKTTKKIETPKPEPTAIEIIAFARRRLEFYLEHELERCRETKRTFINAAVKADPADLDLGYLVKRHAEDIFLASVTEREVMALTTFYKKSIDSQDGGVQYIMETLQKEQTTIIRRLLESPYRHNSTCAMSNFHQECELRAKSEFWRPSGIGRSTAEQILSCLRDWLAAETEILNAYRQ